MAETSRGEHMARFAAGTLFASLVATGVGNAVHEGIEITDTNDTRYDRTTEQFESAGTPHISVVDAKPRNILEQYELDGKVHAAWAEEFEADPHVGEFDLANVATLFEVMGDLKQQGYGKITLVLTGYASAEDDNMTDGIAGLDKLRDRNAPDLAQRRADLLTPILTGRAEQIGLTIESVEYKKPVEDIIDEDDTLDGEIKILDTLHGLATQFGYQDVTAMIKHWNRAPQDTPPDVEALLNRVLLPQRFVKVAVRVGQKKICEVPVRHVITHDAGGDRTQEHYWLLPFPAYVPRLPERRPKPKPTPVPPPAGPEPDDTSDLESLSVDGRIPVEDAAATTSRRRLRLPAFLRNIRLPGRPEINLPSIRLPRWLGYVALIPITGGLVWGCKEVGIDHHGCYFTIDKKSGDWLPDDLHFHNPFANGGNGDCPVPENNEPGPNFPTSPPDPCYGLPHKEVVVETKRIEERNGQSVSVSTETEPAPLG